MLVGLGSVSEGNKSVICIYNKRNEIVLFSHKIL
jgi:hypothetical protein